MKIAVLITLFSVELLAFIKAPNGGDFGTIFEGPGAVALGGAGLAAKSSNESPHLNPATLPLLDGYHFGAIYSAESHGERAGANKYHLVAAEATDEVLFPGAISYSSAGYFRNGKDTFFQQVHASFGKEVFEFMSAGAAIKYVTIDQQHKAQQSGVSSTLGLFVTPHESVGLALVFDDSMSTVDLPTNPTVGVGSQYVFPKILRLRADVVQPQMDNPNRENIYKMGLESLFMGHDLSFRLGYRQDNFREKSFGTAGLGWQGPKLGINYAFEQNLSSEDFRHIIDMLLQF